MAHAKNALEGKTEFVSVKEGIKEKSTSYTAAMGSLTAIMGGELLRHDKDDERRAIIAWIWQGKIWEKHDELTHDRIQDTGEWIFERSEFQDWLAVIVQAQSFVTECVYLITCKLTLAGAGKSFITYILFYR